MGAWGSNIFENDAALDMVDDALRVATVEIEAFCAADQPELEELEAILACVAIHLTLHEHCNARAPDRTLAEALRDKMRRTFEERIDLLAPKEDYKTARHAVLVQTLDRYVQASETE